MEISKVRKFNFVQIKSPRWDSKTVEIRTGSSDVAGAVEGLRWASRVERAADCGDSRQMEEVDEAGHPVKLSRNDSSVALGDP